MNNLETPVYDASSGKLSGIGRALVLAGNLDQQTAEQLFSKAHAQKKALCRNWWTRVPCRHSLWHIRSAGHLFLRWSI